MRFSALVALLLIVSAGMAQENVPHPGYPPTMLLASAGEEGGKVLIQMSRPGPLLSSEGETAKPGDRLMTEWIPLRKVTLGETVQAFGVDGKPVEPTEVLKALANPKGVGVFMRNYANDPLTPPTFYRELFREGTLLLVASPEDLYNPRP